ncbi:MAG: hypothetical protein EA394_00245, partial [Bacteroidia bacterium]
VPAGRETVYSGSWKSLREGKPFTLEAGSPCGSFQFLGAGKPFTPDASEMIISDRLSRNNCTKKTGISGSKM